MQMTEEQIEEFIAACVLDGRDEAMALAVEAQARLARRQDAGVY